ncbi:tagaturonate reductase [Bacillus sp. AK128]
MQTLSKETYKEFRSYPEKVLQFGTGNFLRAFTDWIIDQLNKEANFCGSVVVAQSTERGKVDQLNEQDGLYTVYLQGIKDGQPSREHSVINSISRGLNLFTQYDDYLQLAANPDLRFIVSNTTEAGITFDENDRLEDRPQNSFPAKLTALLYDRYQAFKGAHDKGFIILPCELVDRNGEELKKCVLQYADLWRLEQNFINWVHDANTFCCTLVDRIVPGFPKDNLEEITTELGYRDDLVVMGEPYYLWVIEGPEWIKQELPIEGIAKQVKIVEDMTPYRTTKVRILNGAHTAMTPVAYLYGLNTVGEAMTDKETREFVEELIHEEVIPTLDVPKEELTTFAKDVVDRFLNPYIHHYFTSIALNSMSKFKARNLPSLLAYQNQKKELPRKLVFSFSALIALYKGKREGEEIQLVDDERILELFRSSWSNYDGTKESLQQLVTTVLGYEQHWGFDLNDIPGLKEAITSNLHLIETLGMRSALKDILDKNVLNSEGAQ